MHLLTSNYSTRDISNILRDVNELVDRADLTENQASALQQAISSCAEVLQSLHELVAKYSTTSSSTDTRQGRVQRIWKRFRTDPRDIRNARHRSVAALASLNAVHSAILRYVHRPVIFSEDATDYAERGPSAYVKILGS